MKLIHLVHGRWGNDSGGATLDHLDDGFQPTNARKDRHKPAVPDGEREASCQSPPHSENFFRRTFQLGCSPIGSDHEHSNAIQSRMLMRSIISLITVELLISVI